MLKRSDALHRQIYHPDQASIFVDLAERIRQCAIALYAARAAMATETRVTPVTNQR